MPDTDRHNVAGYPITLAEQSRRTLATLLDVAEQLAASPTYTVSAPFMDMIAEMRAELKEQSQVPPDKSGGLCLLPK